MRESLLRFKSSALAAPMTTKPIFILGNPRSGTTLLRLVLTTNSQLVIPPEAGFMCWLWNDFSHVTASEWRQPQWREKFVSAVVRSRKFETWRLSRSIIMDEISSRRVTAYSEACESVYLAFTKQTKPGATRWGDKNNFHTLHVDLLRGLFPNALFLHIIRDPRDVACSYRDVTTSKSTSPYKPALPAGFREIGEEWARNIGRVCRAGQQMPPGSFRMLRYEDFVSRPEQVTRDLCHWLDLPFEQNMLDFHKINKRDRLEPAETMDWKKRTLEPFDPTRIARYRSELGDADRRMIESAAGELMELLGYQTH
jgi:hypothetical protein